MGVLPSLTSGSYLSCFRIFRFRILNFTAYFYWIHSPAFRFTLPPTIFPWRPVSSAILAISRPRSSLGFFFILLLPPFVYWIIRFFRGQERGRLFSVCIIREKSGRALVCIIFSLLMFNSFNKWNRFSRSTNVTVPIITDFFQNKHFCLI